MNLFNIFDTQRDEYQLVVVLQDEQACWFRWRGQELMGSWSEPMAADSLPQQTCCPWVRSEEEGAQCQVRLVLDTRLDEVDRVKVDGLSEGWLQSFQRRRMARRLQVEYPSASIHRLPDYASPDVLSVVHHLIPAEWEAWARQMQSQDICFTHAVTSLELLCECEAGWSSLSGSPVNGVKNSDGPALIDIPVGKERRHLLVDNGVPLFMRVVAEPDEALNSGQTPALLESLQHARDQITHDERFPPVLGPASSWPELEQHLQTPGTLAALSVGFPVSLQRMPVTSSDEPASTLVHCVADLHPTEKSLLGRLSGSAVSTIGRWLYRRGKQHQWSLTDGRRFPSDFMQPSITRNRLRLRIQQLQRATLICAWMAAGCVAIASTHGINSARERARLSNEQQQLSRQIVQLKESVSVLNEEPEFVVSSLARIDAHKSIKPMDALGVLTTVASVVDDFPMIVLDSLSWSVMPDNQPVDHAFTVISQVTQRERLWQSDTAVARLQVDISGTITDRQGRGLRAQQAVLQAFVDELQALPEVAAVKVLEAPVNAARSSARIAREGSGYHVSLQLGVF